ncbi:MAG: ATP synthase subunit C [Waddliaceae bacterium]
MESLILILGWLGIFAPAVLGAIGSVIGCSKAGQAACGVMLEVEGGYGRFIGVSVLPSSQIIYGIVIMLSLNREVTVVSSPGIFAIGILSGLALLFAAIYQGDCCAASINTSKSKPEVFGLSIAPAAVVEGFAVFVFVFALVLIGTLPKEA